MRVTRALRRALCDELRPRAHGVSVMAMKRRIIFALCLVAATASAQETPQEAPQEEPQEEPREAPLGAADWRAYAEGWTLHFEDSGAAFGAETYLPGDAVIWKPEGGACAHGYWTGTQGRICFLYQDSVACWRMFRDGDGVLARPADGGGPSLRVARRDRAPLMCPETPAV